MALYSRPFESSGRQTLQRTVVLAGLIVAVVAAAYWPSRHTAFVFDDKQAFRSRCNLDMIELEPLAEESDLWLVHQLIEDHVRFTGSPRGKKLLDTWDHITSRFVKVMPIEYKRVLAARRAANRSRPITAPHLEVNHG